MIIKSYRTPTNFTHARFRNHVFRGHENESITVIQGVEQDVADCFSDARRENREHAIRHFIISPGAETTRQEMMQVVRDLAREFGFNIEAATIVEHQKPRFGLEGFDRHWHVLVPDWYESDGRVLNFSFNFARQEKIARLAEWRLGHPLVEGAHNAAVISALKRDGFRQAALALADAFPDQLRPRASFTHEEAQRAKRLGADLSQVRAVCRDAWRNTLTVGEFEARLAESELCLSIAENLTPVWVIANADGKTLLRVTQAAHVTKAEVSKRLGEPNGKRRQTFNEPVRDVIEWDRGSELPFDRDPRFALGHSGVATEPHGGNSKVSARSFIEGLNDYAHRIQQFAAKVERATIPKSVRTEELLARWEAEARQTIATAANVRLPESGTHAALRRDLSKADDIYKEATRASEKAYEDLVALRELPVPGLFGRKQHIKTIDRAEARYDTARSKLDKATENRRGAAERLSIRAASDAKALKEHAAPFEAAAASARQKLIIAKRVRTIMSKDPTLLRFGPVGLCHLGARLVALEQKKGPWDGKVDMWGIPIEPPAHATI